jgi:hypothetical protein
MTKGERDEMFQAMLEKAKDTVARNKDAKGKWKRPEDMGKAEWKIACAIRIMREKGMVWWQLAYALGLPGSADALPKGKSGAGYARRLYAKAFGEKPSGRVASTKGSSASLTARVMGSFFRDGQLDDEIVSAVLGKKLIWRIRLHDATGTVILEKEDEAVASPKKVTIVDTPDGGRALRFNSVIKSDDNPYTWWPGGERTVRVDSILQVLEGMPDGARVL